MVIYLRPITEQDTKMIVKWRNSPKVLSHCMTKTPITEESHAKFFQENIVTGKYKQYIVERIEEQSGIISYPIATCYLKDMDYGNKRCELCVFTSDDAEWNEESQKIGVSKLLEIAFNEYGMHKVYSYVFSKNTDEISLLAGAGFQEEAVLKEEALNLEGQYEDIVRLSVTRN